MVTADETGRFLQAEEEATRLVEELVALRTETDNYRSAHAAIHQTVDAVTSMSARLLEIAEGIGNVSAILREIGTPELVARLESLRVDLDSSRDGIATLDHQLSSSTGTLDNRLTVIESTLDAIASQQSVLDQRLQDQSVQTVGAINQSESRVNGQVSDVAQLMGQHFDAAQSAATANAEALRRVLAVALLAVILLVATIVLLVLA